MEPPSGRRNFAKETADKPDWILAPVGDDLMMQIAAAKEIAFFWFAERTGAIHLFFAAYAPKIYKDIHIHRGFPKLNTRLLFPHNKLDFCGIAFASLLRQ